MTTPAKSNTEIQKASPVYGLAAKFNIEPSKLLEVLRGTVIKPAKNGQPATNEEVAAFCIVAQQYNLNPFTREIHAFTSGEKGIVPIVGIDGWTHIVNASGEFDGCEFDEIGDEKGNPIAITCKMHVKNRQFPVCATERYAECKRNTIPWNTMPWRMLRHKAYMQAARYAFGLAGIYDEDEARDIVSVNTTPIREPILMPKAISETSQQQPTDQGEGTDLGPEKPATPPSGKGASQSPKEPEPPAQTQQPQESFADETIRILAVENGIEFGDCRDFLNTNRLVEDAESLGSYTDVPESAWKKLRASAKMVNSLIKTFGKPKA